MTILFIFKLYWPVLSSGCSFCSIVYLCSFHCIKFKAHFSLWLPFGSSALHGPFNKACMCVCMYAVSRVRSTHWRHHGVNSVLTDEDRTSINMNYGIVFQINVNLPLLLLYFSCTKSFVCYNYYVTRLRMLLDSG